MTDQTMLYRPAIALTAFNPEAWNLPLDTLIVEDGAIDAARADGWLTGAEAVEALVPNEDLSPYDSILDTPVAEIVPLLNEFTVDELSLLLAAEHAGKTRKGLITEIEKALAAKGV